MKLPLLVNSEGIIGANPDFEMPAKSKMSLTDTQLKEYGSMEGFVPFEDQEQMAAILIEMDRPERFFKINNQKGEAHLRLNTIIEADVEFEVVIQVIDRNRYRRVLRLKD